MKTKKASWEKRIDNAIWLFYLNTRKGKSDWVIKEHKKVLKSFISQELKREGIKTLEEAVELSDRIEAGKETTFEEWRAFKHFRNTLRDRLKEREGK